MTKNELLAGFLDRSLSEDEMLEFEQLRATDSSFGHHVNDMMSVEKLLSTSAPIIVPPAQFLTTVESVVAGKVVAGASSGFLSGLFSSAWTWVTVGSIALISAGTVYYNQPAEQKIETPQIAEQVVTSPVAAPQREMPAAEVEIAAPDNVPSPAVGSASDRPAVVNDERLVETPHADAAPDFAETKDLGAESYPPAIEKLIQNLEACRASAKHAACAQQAIALGNEFQKRNSPNSAIKYFVIALDEARASKIVNYQVQAAGSLGIAERDGGRVDKARMYLQEAITLGKENKIMVDRWEKALKTIK